jgi:hypothetical protein
MASTRLELTARVVRELDEVINEHLECFADDEEAISFGRLRDKLHGASSEYSMGDLRTLHQLLEEVTPDDTHDPKADGWHLAMAQVEVGLGLVPEPPVPINWRVSRDAADEEEEDRG